MKASEILNTKAAAYVGVAIVGVVVAWYVFRKARGVAADAVDLVNPASSGNIVNRGVTAVGSAISGDSDWTLGGWFYDLTHPAYDPNANATSTPATSWMDLVKMGGK